MMWLTRFIRYLDMVGEPMAVPNTISGLPPFALRNTVDALARSGWIRTFEYEGADAWVDYARVDLRKGRSKLRLEWDQDSGGSVAGPRAVLDTLRMLDPWTGGRARTVAKGRPH